MKAVALLLAGAACGVSAFAPSSPRCTHHVSPPRWVAGSSQLSVVATAAIPQISPADVQTLSSQGYVVVPNFLPQQMVDELRQDIRALRSSSAFKQAKIGQDSTNELNTNIRIAETCFLGRNRPELTSIASAGGSNSVRDRINGLYDILDGLCDSLSELSQRDTQTRLDKSLSELLYAYYPTGGYYRRHRDAIPNSASVLRRYSLLLYLNEEGWSAEKDAGQLRIHLDGGDDECPPGVAPNFVDVDPLGGTERDGTARGSEYELGAVCFGGMVQSARECRRHWQPGRGRRRWRHCASGDDGGGNGVGDVWRCKHYWSVIE